MRRNSLVLLSKWVGETGRISCGKSRKKQDCFIETNMPFLFQVWRNRDGRRLYLLGTKLFMNKANTFQFFHLGTWQIWPRANMQCSFLNKKHPIKWKSPACDHGVLTSDSDLTELTLCHTQPHCVMQLIYYSCID